MSNTLEEASSWSFCLEPFEHMKKIKVSRAVYAVKKKIQEGTILMCFEFRLCIVNAQSKANQLNLRIRYNFWPQQLGYLDWKWSSEWLESREGLLLATDVSTTSAEAIVRASESSHVQSQGWSRCCGCLSYVNWGMRGDWGGHLRIVPWSPLVPFPSGQQ